MAGRHQGRNYSVSISARINPKSISFETKPEEPEPPIIIYYLKKYEEQRVSNREP